MIAGDHTFTKADRLLGRRDFLRLEKSGARFREGELRATMLPNELGRPRLGLAVSKRVGNAVARNRVKRVLREVFRLHRDRLPSSIDLVLFPTGGERCSHYGLAREDFLRLATKLGRTNRASPRP